MSSGDPRSTVFGTRSVHLDLPAELLVLVADELDRLLVRHHALVDAHRKWLGECLRILDSHVNLELAVDRTPEALGERGLTAVRRTAHIEPSVNRALFCPTKIVGLDDERVALPAPDR